MNATRLASVRPLVRYVDENQAVIDTHIAMHPPLPHAQPLDAADVLLEIIGGDGSLDEQRVRLPLKDSAGVMRMQVVRPERWWPAGMGDQSLYQIRVSVLAGDEVVDSRDVTLGFTSVRPGESQTIQDSGFNAGGGRASWLVNGQLCEINAIVPIDLVHEKRLLPVAGHSLLLVRGHYGPDVLYDAADRAGLLLIQCIPIDPSAKPEVGVVDEIERLAAHPSLAGWFVGHLGRMADNVAETIRRLDPTRNVFRHVPGA